MGVENNIPEGWEITFLSEVTNYLRRGITPKYCENESIFIINQRCIRDNKVSLLNARFHDLSLKDVGDEKRLKFGDILICSTGVGTLGRVAQYKLNNTLATVDSHVTIVRPNDNICKLFLGLLLSGKEREIEFLAVGTTGQTELPRTSLGLLQINLPPLSEQKVITKILTAFDDKIELLQAQNKTLETMAQTIFKEWFGKYQIGDELPNGWKVDSLNNIALEITRGFTTSYVEKSDIINLNQKVNKGKKLDKQHFKYYPNDTIVPSNKFIKKYDILLNSLGQGTLGRVHLYKENTTNVVADQHVSILRFSNDLSYYVYQILASKSGQYRLENEITGSTGMLMLNIGRVRDFKIIVPTKEKLELFKKSLDPIYGTLELQFA